MAGRTTTPKATEAEAPAEAPVVPTTAEAVEALRTKGLTPRQAEVFVMIHGGAEDGPRVMTNKAVATSLNIDAGTVSNAYTEGRRTLGLTVASPAAKAKAPEAVGPQAMAEALVTSAVEALTKGLGTDHTAEAEAKAIGTKAGAEAFVASRTKAIQDHIAALTAEAEALTTDEGRTKAIAAEVLRRQAKATAAKANRPTVEAIAALTADVTNATVAAKALGLTDEAVAAIVGTVVDDATAYTEALTAEAEAKATEAKATTSTEATSTEATS